METDYDPAYYARRADQARELAARAIDPGVKRIHIDMASRYAEMALRPRSTLRLPAGSK